MASWRQSGWRFLRRQPTRSGLVIAEVALALALMTCASLMLITVLRLQEVDLGFQPDRLLTVRVDLPAARQGASAAPFYAELLAAVENLPGVRAVSLSSDVPLSGARHRAGFEVEGLSTFMAGTVIDADYCLVSPSHFRSLGANLLKGRDFTASDGPSSPRVVIINEALANLFWSGGDPLGSRLLRDTPEGLWSGEIVGVVNDIRYRPQDEATPMMYWPFAQSPPPSALMMVRATGDPEAVVASVRKALQARDQGLLVYDFKTMGARMDDWVSPHRFIAGLLMLFGLGALGLAAMGVYGVTAYAAGQRRHEIGVRIALGARRWDMLTLIFAEGLITIALGLAIGSALALVLSRFLGAIVYEASISDPEILVASALPVLLAAAIAVFLPAWKSSRLDPGAALRHE